MYLIIKIVLISILILISISFIWFDFIFLSINGKSFKKIFKRAEKESDVILIFNTGGWGTVDYFEAFDLYPVGENILKHFKKNKLKTSVIQYYRTKDDLIGKVAYFKDYFFAFPKESKQLASIIKDSKKKIILLGLSNGALLADEVMEKLLDKKNIFSIELGKPFFGVNTKHENVLRINNPKDDLSNGKRLELFKRAFVIAPLKWLKNLCMGKRIPLGAAVKIDGHEYLWKEIRPEVINFIDKKIL